MPVPDSIVSAAAGLIGAAIGGACTYFASRVQWQRESRRTAYGALISAAYEVEALIASGAKAGEEGSAQADPRTVFYSRLDSSSLLARSATQRTLYNWRRLSWYVNRLAEIEEAERTELLDEWRKRRIQFYEFAKDELGVKGRLAYRRTSVFYCMLAFASTASWWPTLSAYRQHPKPVLLHAAVALLLTSIVTLGLGFWSVQRWKHAKDYASGELRPAKIYSTIAAWQIAKNTPPAQIAISISLFLELLNIWFWHASISPDLGFFSFVALLFGFGTQFAIHVAGTFFPDNRFHLFRFESGIGRKDASRDN